MVAEGEGGGGGGGGGAGGGGGGGEGGGEGEGEVVSPSHQGGSTPHMCARMGCVCVWVRGCIRR